jgi:hypothetical protein
MGMTKVSSTSGHQMMMNLMIYAMNQRKKEEPLVTNGETTVGKGHHKHQKAKYEQTR